MQVQGVADLPHTIFSNTALILLDTEEVYLRERSAPYDPAVEGSTGEKAKQARAYLGLPALKGPPAKALPSRPAVMTHEKRHFLLTLPERPRSMPALLRKRPETAADRFLAASAHGALRWFLKVHNAPKAKRGVPVASKDKELYRAVRDGLPKKQLAFLCWLSEHEDAAGVVVASAVEIGKQIIDSADPRRSQGGVEGYLAAVAENIEHWRFSCSIKLGRVKKSLP